MKNTIKEKKFYAVKETDVIYNQFQDFINRLKVTISTVTNNTVSIEEQKRFIDSINVLFNFDTQNTYNAYASYDFKNQEQNLIVFNMYSNTDYIDTITHEIAHLIYSHFQIGLFNKSGPHCLEFAIIAYVLNYQFQCINTYNKPFFRSYDIYEDVAYPNISINPSKFDSLIKLIKWNDLNDLVQQATHISRKIRKKLVV